MKTMNIKPEDINKLDPSKLAFSHWVGSDDISVMDGSDMFRLFDEYNPSGVRDLRNVIEYLIKDSSGNSYEFIYVDNCELKKLVIQWK